MGKPWRGWKKKYMHHTRHAQGARHKAQGIDVVCLSHQEIYLGCSEIHMQLERSECLHYNSRLPLTDTIGAHLAAPVMARAKVVVEPHPPPWSDLLLLTQGVLWA